ncbi:MAG TPA: DoxX family protein [Prosthecobacter sp.]|nr:DoxX family protein [Prosthecobacter sp.]
MNKLLHLSFLPTSVDFGLLLLRLLTGVTMIWVHGWGKLTGFQSMVAKFPNPIPGTPNELALGLAVFAEVVCAGLIVLGLFTRLAAFILIINMSVAFFVIHKANLVPGPGSGELALLYLGGFLVLFFTGAGRYSVDRR